MIKTKGGIYVSFETGFGSDYDLPCVVFQRGAAVVRVGVRDAPYGYEMRIVAADREGLLSDLGCVIAEPEVLQSSLDLIAGALDCPHHEPMHYHHDGCPCVCEDVHFLEGYHTELKTGRGA